MIAIHPDADEIRAAAVSQRQPEGKVTYCEDYNAVCAALKDTWPVSVAKVILC